jgi:CRISPR system Cascade subunit CasC
MSLNVDVHVIQSVPPSNLNRDDAGSPKTAVYGGVRRARVSSQAWKRATRRDFEGYLGTSEFGVRTKRAMELLGKRIEALQPDVDESVALGKAKSTLEAAGLKTKAARKAAEGTPELTEYLVFFSNQQLDKLAQLAVDAGDGSPTGAAAKKVLKEGNSFDLALFGRMVANDADLNVDAACQVAHALSTHAVTNEFDYYTAVDDKNPEEETGAGMIGTVEFNSATLYRYATVNVGALHDNLGHPEATARAIEAFVRSFVQSMPTGKQNTFANGTLPEAVVVMVRDGQGVNLVGAFEDAVPVADGYVAASCRALATYAKEVADAYAASPVSSWVTRIGEATASLDALGERVAFDGLVSAVGQTVRASLPETR